VNKLQAKEKQEQLLKWFILPNESIKWDSTLEKYVVADSKLEVNSGSERKKQLDENGFDKDFIVTNKRKKRDRYYY
jgi:hypothetical protein